MGSFTEEQTQPVQTPFDVVAAIQHFKEISVGAGSTIFKANSEGVFLGATNFTDAPFSVDYNGVLKALNGVFKGDITGASGAFSGALNGATGSFSGALTASSIVDDTFGLNGCFIKQIKTTDYSTSVLAIPIYRADGTTPISTGLLAVIANWYSSSTGRYNFLPGINNATGTSYFSVQKNSGNYEIRHLGDNQGDELPSPGYTIYTCLFSSDESTYF